MDAPWILVGLLVAVAAMVIIRFIRLSTRGSDWKVVAPGDPPVATRGFRCQGPRGDVMGSCAESWWDHFWNGRTYCKEVKF